MKDDDGDEEDGFDETLIPVDYTTAGQIRDDVVYAELVGRMPEGSTLTCLMDCCHSGSVLDLPYTFKADGEQQEMGQNPNIHMSKLKMMAIAYVVNKIFGNGVGAQVVMMLVNGAMGGGNMGNMLTMGLVQKLASVACH